MPLNKLITLVSMLIGSVCANVVMSIKVNGRFASHSFSVIDQRLGWQMKDQHLG